MSTTKTISGYSPEEEVFSFSNADAEVVLAHVSDIGNETANKQSVADLVYSWRPDAIFTSGDNCDSTVQNYALNVGSYYGEYVARDLIWPVPGNHDWDDNTLAAYFSYFSSVVGAAYYYKKTFGPISLFMLDSNANTPDGNTTSGAQYAWLARELAASCSPWNIVSQHHPAYGSSLQYGSVTAAQWGYGALGADIVFNGHAHLYERSYNDTYYISAGTGGSALYSFTTPTAYSQFRYNTLHGAGKLIATPNKLRWEWRNVSGALIDSLELEK
jgi:predicted phosphodiesterase